MLFLKSTTVTKAPGIYEVDVAAKPPGKTFGIFMATDPDNPPNAVFAALAELGFQNTYKQAYTHKDKGKVLDVVVAPGQRHSGPLAASTAIFRFLNTCSACASRLPSPTSWPEASAGTWPAI